jgi:RNA polymerase sigma-70 factor (sigma-E family)
VAEAPADYLEFAAARSRHLFRTACLLTGDWHLAEDLVQETLAKMYRSWRRIDRTDTPVAYVNTVLVHLFLSQRRRRSSDEYPSDNLPEPAGRSEDPELRLTLLEALARMSPRDRAVLVLRYWEDRSADETALNLGTTPEAVRAQCLRALQRLSPLMSCERGELVCKVSTMSNGAKVKAHMDYSRDPGTPGPRSPSWTSCTPTAAGSSRPGRPTSTGSTAR